MRRIWVIGVAVFALGASPASGITLFAESFQGAAVSSASWVAGGSGGVVAGQWEAGAPNGAACLTAGDNIAAAPIAGCTTPTALDSPGSGVLRLTPADFDRAGFALYNQALPTANGLDITFHQFQWGGTGADGVSFFLVDGATNLTTPGGSGGALGYSPRDGTTPGVPNGLIGVGFDVAGNYSNPPVAGGTGCAGGTGVGSAGPGNTPNVVAIRGPGNGLAEYCWLGASSPLTLRDTTRALSDHTVRIVFDAATAATRNVTVFFDGVQVIQIGAPTALVSAPSFKFGFSGSTGGGVDIHEVCCLTIEEASPASASLPLTARFTG